MSPVCKSIFESLNSEGHTGFLENVYVKFIDKADLENPEKKRKLLDTHFKNHGNFGLKYS